VVAVHAFQMRCPGCVSHALPQAPVPQRLFDHTGLITLDLHSVFEHHAAMRFRALGPSCTSTASTSRWRWMRRWPAAPCLPPCSATACAARPRWC
jgi:hypothetical protein